MQKPSSVNEEIQRAPPTPGMPLYGDKTPFGQPWHMFVLLTGVLGLAHIPCASCGHGDELFVINTYKEGMEEGKNGVS